jgi:hypothetical protein
MSQWGNKLFLKHIYPRQSDWQKGRLIFLERETDNDASLTQLRVVKNLHYPTMYVHQSFFLQLVIMIRSKYIKRNKHHQQTQKTH